MNITQLDKVSKNNKSLYRKYISLTNSQEYYGVVDLFEYVKSKKSICINLNLESLNAVLLSNEYLNIFQLGFDPKSIKARYDNVAPYFDKLLEFIKIFDPNKQIKYASLRTGGLGSNFPGFGSGQIGIILSREFMSRLEDEIFCLCKFSLNYFRNDLTFREKKFFEDISTWNYIEYLTVVKHKNEFKVNRSNWDNMISNSRGWLEILIYNKILLNDFEEIIFDYEYLSYLKALKKRDDLSKYEEALSFNFMSIMTLIRKNNLILNPIKYV